MNSEHADTRMDMRQEMLSGLAIGTWSLLPAIRSEVAAWLERRSLSTCGRDWRKRIRPLLSASAQKWKTLYSDKDYLARLSLVAGQSISSVEPYTTLLGYIDKHEKQRTAPPLDALLVPYLLTVDHLGDVGWRFPPSRFREAWHGPSPYPFFEPKLFFLLDEETRKARTGAVQPVARKPGAERLVQGMTSLQPKIIGDYTRLKVRSNPIDSLVGNGSAILYVLRNQGGEAFGVLCIASPIFGLFNELLVAPKRGAPEDSELHSAVFVCRAQLANDDHPYAVDAEIEGVPLRVCPHCANEIAVTPACPLGDLSGVVEPLLGDYLHALRQSQHQEDIRRHARLVHEFRYRTAAAYSTLSRAIKNDDRTLLSTALGFVEDVRVCVDHHPELIPARYSGTTDLVRVATICRNLAAATFQAPIALAIEGTPRQVEGAEAYWRALLHGLLENALNAHTPAAAGESMDGIRLAVVFSSTAVSIAISNDASDFDGNAASALEALLNGRHADARPVGGAGDAPRGANIAAGYVALLKLRCTVHAQESDGRSHVTVSLHAGGRA